MNRLRKKAEEIRKKTLEIIFRSKAGHLGGSMSDVEILVALFYRAMHYDPQNPKWKERDRFILSKGHSAESYYAVLSDVGFFPEDELKRYGTYRSRLMGHPNTKIPGVEISTGALGHGLSCGVGMALGNRMNGVGSKCFVLMGDGELAEGSVWEAAMAAANYKLDHLVAIIDRNGLQISGPTEQVMRTEPLKDKWEAFGWKVLEADGHDIDALSALFENAPAVPGKPTMVIAHTVKGKGVPFAENIAKWHHGVPNEEEYQTALRAIEKSGEEIQADGGR